VGMFEHVGRRSYPDYFRKICDLMRDDGVALVHSIGFFDLCMANSNLLLRRRFLRTPIATDTLGFF